MADVNGDGAADAVFIARMTSGTRVAVNLASGDGTFGPEFHNVTQTQGDYTGWQTSTMADVNRDGAADAVFIGQLTTGTRVAVNLSDGDGTFGPEFHNVTQTQGDYTTWQDALCL